jgi:hypothetical protein
MEETQAFEGDGSSGYEHEPAKKSLCFFLLLGS